MNPIYLDGQSLTLEDFIKVTRENYPVQLSPKAIQQVEASRQQVETFLAQERNIYGITTGFGKFCDVHISSKQLEQLQHNLIVSHACGIGEPLSIPETRGVLLLRANALAKGFSGIRLETLQMLLDLLNHQVHPIIPEKGSLGASGDLAPLSHMVLVMLGEGEAFYQGQRLRGSQALQQAQLKPLTLQAKEGLALINGTQVLTSIGAHALYDAQNLAIQADLIASLTIEALNGITEAFDPRIQDVRPHQGQIDTARNLRTFLEGSEMTSHQGELRVQDAYSIRCIPQIHGASKDSFNYIQEKIEIEMNAVTDNPIIFNDTQEAISGGNFHGQPLALPFDFLKIAIAELANVSERRIERLVNPHLSDLPAFLSENGGLNSGFMVVQYAAAALVSENKILAHPASVDSIPSSANQEDHVSMGTIAARHARDILDNSRKVLAMELLSACQGIDLRDKKRLGNITEQAYQHVRQHLPKVEEDTIMYPLMNKAEEILKSSTFLHIIQPQ